MPTINKKTDNLWFCEKKKKKKKNNNNKKQCFKLHKLRLHPFLSEHLINKFSELSFRFEKQPQ